MSIQNFPDRHIGPSPVEIAEMLKEIGLENLEQLVDETIPSSIHQGQDVPLFNALSEEETLKKVREVAARNKVLFSMIGQGYYNTVLPLVIQRNILENPAWYTAYTPYQPEISQGRLEALLNFQTMVSDLTGLAVANASLLDEATAAAEAMALARKVSRSDKNIFFIDEDCHPQTIAVIKTRAETAEIDIQVGSPKELNPVSVFGALFQYPGSSGQVEDYSSTISSLHENHAIACLAVDLLAMTLLKSPGELQADVAIGSVQRFGLPLGFGGPHAGFMAVKEEYKRALPGRIVGVSVDSRKQPALRLALQTREQHIRREKATSNICTAQALPAILASMYAVWHGPEGLHVMASRIHTLTKTLVAGLRLLGYDIKNSTFFDTITVKTDGYTEVILHNALQAGINLRHSSPESIGISFDEKTTPDHIHTLWQCFSLKSEIAAETIESQLGALPSVIPDSLQRSLPYLTHPVFSSHRSETALLRYMRTLSDKDLALDRTMIPLGSCTMKLNATIEMLPLTWPGFSDIHPFVPDDQSAGYREMIADMEKKLCLLSGYDAISFQPNSGAQGEYAGLLAIRHYHHAKGDFHRTICLIPSSAHGTNPASAHMAGMDVVVVECDQKGNVDISDLKAKIAQHHQTIAAIMITYPSTHGVFEESIKEICALVHQAGGQVYLDGANMNAQIGISRPGDYGADVSHFNLHKTFCIPHGGGGPGMGPIGVKKHLIPYLPEKPEKGSGYAVSATQFGSASILPISWVYMLLMGSEGLRKATEIAILNANYIASRLNPFFPVLYSGERGHVAHECIIDLRPLKQATGVTVEDVAKRLMDFGFHAPTVSFPVAGTLMIEPTESENKYELDRFCDAMIMIRKEISEIENGTLKVEESPLRHAPHTVRDATESLWARPYSREKAFLPGTIPPGAKYWPPVNRVDNAYGDRNLICSCPPMAAYS
nr:aminomethyl-transferring glycine dehydrogenase [Entomobacter blattae]